MALQQKTAEALAELVTEEIPEQLVTRSCASGSTISTIGSIARG